MHVGNTIRSRLGRRADLGNGNGQRIQRQRQRRTMAVAAGQDRQRVIFDKEDRVIGYRIEFDSHNLAAMDELVAHRAVNLGNAAQASSASCTR